MERASYVADYNQLMLGCNPVVWKTCWIDQRGYVRKRSVPFQSNFGINTKVCSPLLVRRAFWKLNHQHRSTHTHTKAKMSVIK